MIGGWAYGICLGQGGDERGIGHRICRHFKSYSLPPQVMDQHADRLFGVQVVGVVVIAFASPLS